MARLYLFAEGRTEATFADILLKRHLAGLGVFLHPPVLIAHTRKHGKVHRGGGRNYLAMKNDICRFLKQERVEDVYFTTMIDLYAIHSDFPGLDQAENLRNDPHARVEALQQAFAEDIGDRRFVPYIQLHEFEAYLFCDPTKFELFYPTENRAIAALDAVAGKFPTPEAIDDGQHTAPSKRIIEKLPDYAGAKSVIGPQVAELIGLDKIRSRCTNFAGWIERLERLGAQLEEIGDGDA